MWLFKWVPITFVLDKEELDQCDLALTLIVYLAEKILVRAFSNQKSYKIQILYANSSTCWGC